jgi:hypothetical protein
MSLEISKLLPVLESAARVFRAARVLASDAALTAGPADRALLLERLHAIQDENDAGHAALQDQLAALVKGTSNGK